MGKAIIRSYAKINLGLRITGRRSNGYHEISSIMALISLYDEIFIEESNSSEVIVPNFPALEDLKTNLAARALSIFTPTYKLTIKKNIPLGAGLGGGSSNAGAILKEYRGSVEQAISLGSDVPFFLNGSLALVEGIGEKVTSLNPNLLPKRDFLILVPDIHCDTRTVYQNFKGNFSEPYNNIVFADIPLFGNDLEEAACLCYPKLKECLDKVRKIESASQLSGSGSSIITFPSTKDRELLVQSLGIQCFSVSWL